MHAALVVAAFTVVAAFAGAPTGSQATDARACDEVPVAPFHDVAGTHAGSVDCALWYEVVRGVAPDRFAPATQVRRDQMASIIARAIQVAGAPLPAPATAHFDDLGGNVHRDAIERLAEAGIVQGRAARVYDPDRPVPRGQMATFLLRAWAHVNGGTVEDPPDAFTDDDGHPHEPSIDRVTALGLASGRTTDTFAPEEPTRRDEIATLVTRLLDRYVGDGHLTPRPVTYRSTVAPLPASLRRTMTGVSWRPGCPVALEELRLVEAVHVGMDGRERWGLLVVHAEVADLVADALGHLHAERFPIRRMELIERYGGDDDRSMAADNTSAFNCRTVAGTSTYSQHAYGRAIDINPVENPYVRAGSVEPPAGRDFVDRADVRPGMIVRPGPVLDAFGVGRSGGWGWGGDWQHSKDYQHLSATGN